MKFDSSFSLQDLVCRLRSSTLSQVENPGHSSFITINGIKWISKSIVWRIFDDIDEESTRRWFNIVEVQNTEVGKDMAFLDVAFVAVHGSLCVQVSDCIWIRHNWRLASLATRVNIAVHHSRVGWVLTKHWVHFWSQEAHVACLCVPRVLASAFVVLVRVMEHAFFVARRANVRRSASWTYKCADWTSFTRYRIAIFNKLSIQGALALVESSVESCSSTTSQTFSSISWHSLSTWALNACWQKVFEIKHIRLVAHCRLIWSWNILVTRWALAWGSILCWNWVCGTSST